jgi:ketosteroid isomerase-like protein
VAHPNEVLMRDGFAAFGRGDIETLRSQYWAEGMRWHVPGKSRLAGDYEGEAQVLELINRIFELSGGTYAVELQDVLANDDQAVSISTAHAERAGTHWEDDVVQVWRIRDGKVTEMWLYVADQYAQDEFWS